MKHNVTMSNYCTYSFNQLAQLDFDLYGMNGGVEVSNIPASYSQITMTSKTAKFLQIEGI